MESIMTIAFTTETVACGAIGIDTGANLYTGAYINNYKPSMVQSLFQSLYRPGYRPFAIRYLGLDPANVAPGDLTLEEVIFLTTMGWGVIAVQERLKGWSAATGTSDGQAAAANFVKCGLLAGVNVFSGAEIFDYQTCVDYENAWFNALVATHSYFEPSAGCYVGSNALNGDQWQNDVPQHIYWKSGANVPTPSQRGYACYQLWPTTTKFGIPVDLCCAQTDWKGSNMIAQVAA
jgi:hypothetical protein